MKQPVCNLLNTNKQYIVTICKRKVKTRAKLFKLIRKCLEDDNALKDI